MTAETLTMSPLQHADYQLNTEIFFYSALDFSQNLEIRRLNTKI